MAYLQGTKDQTQKWATDPAGPLLQLLLKTESNSQISNWLYWAHFWGVLFCTPISLFLGPGNCPWAGPRDLNTTTKVKKFGVIVCLWAGSFCIEQCCPPAAHSKSNRTQDVVCYRKFCVLYKWVLWNRHSSCSTWVQIEVRLKKSSER
jgi:hypothetical protein